MSEPVYITRLPVFYDMQYVTEEGRLTPDAYLFNDEAYRVLFKVVNQFIEGIRVPQVPTASASPGDPSIELYRDDDNVPIGTLWYDVTLNKLVVKTAIGPSPAPGTVEEITSVVIP